MSAFFFPGYVSSLPHLLARERLVQQQEEEDENENNNNNDRTTLPLLWTTPTTP